MAGLVEGEPRLFFGLWHIFLFILVGDLEDVVHQLLDTDVNLRASFEVAYIELLCEILSTLCSDLSLAVLIGQVKFVADKHYGERPILVLVDTCDPISHVKESLVHCQVKRDDDTVCVLEETIS